MRHAALHLLFALSVFLYGTLYVSADEFSSMNYSVSNPIVAPGAYSTSTSFSLNGAFSQISIGTSTITSFGDFSGFLYFPYVSTPAVSATAGDASVALSWTASEGFLGWTVFGYAIGRSLTPGGPYLYTSVGNILAANVAGLSNGTLYYFVVRAADAFGDYIATSTEISATPIAAAPGGGGGGGGGGGSGGGTGYTAGGVEFSGRAYPLSKVSILKDGQIAITTIAGPDSNFSTTISNLSGGNYNFAVYGEDNKGRRSNPFTFPIYITPGVTTKISGIFISPTIAVDKSEVKKGEDIAIFGQSTSASEVTISVNSTQEYFIKKTTDANGIYLLNFDTSVLEMGSHSTKSKAAKDGEVSSFSNTVGFKVGTKTVVADSGLCAAKGDLNNDCRVNLVDFSIAAFWYKKTLSKDFQMLESVRLNGDKKVDLVDFSIMAYYWTG